jgi:hypothetical protein
MEDGIDNNESKSNDHWYFLLVGSFINDFVC